ncbi:MAG: MBL fold metallo-hydrolase [Candidatus Hydrogenedentes bacterium]|nr:MBL fold metallo-hydrolase [Candidatus Hydrogenedentota bacterium]
MTGEEIVTRYQTRSGIEVFKLPVWAFADHVTNCYLVLDDAVTLIDCSSAIGDANGSLERCFANARSEFGLTVDLKDVDRLIITHGHIDHFGGANHVLEQSGATIAIHELDVSTLQNFEERRVITAKDLQVFLKRTGLSAERVASMLEMNRWSKGIFQSVKVDIVLQEGPMPDSPFFVHHAPGHCPGQVCLQLDDILFTADHVLDKITPHQSPEFISRNMGLGHYFDALKKIRVVEGVRLGLGGHLRDIPDVAKRIDETLAFHELRLEKTRAICQEPKTLAEISRALFGKRESYHVLLAILEAGAHVEYLYERGLLQVVNHEAIEDAVNPVLQYQVL